MKKTRNKMNDIYLIVLHETETRHARKVISTKRFQPYDTTQRGSSLYTLQ